ncbi:MAG: hypothetical protein ACTSO7_00705 [Candidatus Heimdallarchaeota archaeon]
MIQSVIISEEAYKQMFQYVIEFAHPERPYRQWREVIGWLVGIVEEETITVLRAIPMTSGNSIFVEMTDYTIIPQIVEEAEKIDAVIVGWFHSHPSFGFFLSSVDIRTQRNQQSLFDNAIALVCDPTKISTTEPGIHGYQVFMEPQRFREYRELDITVKVSKSYPDLLNDMLQEAGITRSYSEVIAYEDLAGLYALEGITPQQLIKAQPGDLLPLEHDALPVIEAEYIVNKSLQSKKEYYLQVKISNLGEGIAWYVDLVFNPSPDLKLLSMYPHRIIEQLNYDSSVIETFKVKPLKSGEIILPQTIVNYMTTNRVNHKVIIRAKKVVVE